MMVTNLNISQASSNRIFKWSAYMIDNSNKEIWKLQSVKERNYESSLDRVCQSHRGVFGSTMAKSQTHTYTHTHTKIILKPQLFKKINHQKWVF